MYFRSIPKAFVQREIMNTDVSSSIIRDKHLTSLYGTTTDVNMSEYVLILFGIQLWFTTQHEELYISKNNSIQRVH